MIINNGSQEQLNLIPSVAIVSNNLVIGFTVPMPDGKFMAFKPSNNIVCSSVENAINWLQQQKDLEIIKDPNCIKYKHEIQGENNEDGIDNTKS